MPDSHSPTDDLASIEACTSHFEAQWRAVRRDGDEWIFSVAVARDELPLFIQSLRKNTRLAVAVVEIADNEKPVDKELADRARKLSHIRRREPRWWAFLMRRYDPEAYILSMWREITTDDRPANIGAFTDLDPEAKDQMIAACVDAMKHFLRISSSSEFARNLTAAELMIRLDQEFRDWHPGDQRPR